MRKINKLILFLTVVLGLTLALFGCSFFDGKPQLATPNGEITGTVLSWGKVDNAIAYYVVVDGTNVHPRGPDDLTFDFSNNSQNKVYSPDIAHRVELQAKGDGKNYSDSKKQELTYGSGTLPNAKFWIIPPSTTSVLVGAEVTLNFSIGSLTENTLKRAVFKATVRVNNEDVVKASQSGTGKDFSLNMKTLFPEVCEVLVTCTATDSSNKEYNLTPTPIVILVRNQLTGLMIGSTATAEGAENCVGDVIFIGAGARPGEMSPPSYYWTVRINGAPEVKIERTADNITYKFPTVGTYVFSVYAVKDGSFMSAVASATLPTITVAPAKTGTEVHSVFLDGYKVESGTYQGDYAPYVRWGVLNASVTEVDVELVRADGTSETFSSTDPLYANNFTWGGGRGFKVPREIASLDDEFSVSVKTKNFGWCTPVTYNGDIVEGNRIFVGKKPNNEPAFTNMDFNQYIVNIEELAELMNYITVFKITSEIEIYCPFVANKTLAQLKDYLSDYPIMEVKPGDAESLQKYAYIVEVASYVYGESSKISFTKKAVVNGSWCVAFENRAVPDTLLTSDAQPNVKTVLPTLTHYSASPRGIEYPDSGFAIDRRNQTLQVGNSTQLYYAVLHGYKPVPTSTSGTSSAMNIFSLARDVMRAIADDGMNDVQKVHAIYDWLTTNVEYDKWLLNYSNEHEGEYDNNISMYEGFYLDGVFVHNTAVCDGIAKAFVLMCAIEGIVALKPTGMAGVENHAWNKVLIGGEWYGIDATWGAVETVASGTDVVTVYKTHYYMFMTDDMLDRAGGDGGGSLGRATYGRFPATATTQLDSAYYTGEVINGWTNSPDSQQKLERLFIEYYFVEFGSPAPNKKLLVEICTTFTYDQVQDILVANGVRPSDVTVTAVNIPSLKRDKNIVYVLIK